MSKDSLNRLKIAALAGGVGGARMVDGIARVVPAKNLTVIVNVGDDFNHLGLKISPDLDTVCYALAGLENPNTGWGQANETYQAFQALSKLGGPDWFKLGDRDLGTHLYRTNRMKQGAPLSEITAELCKAWGINTRVLPITNYQVPTIVHSDQGDLAFQDYFVRQRCEPQVTGFSFQGAGAAEAVHQALKAIEEADLIVISPSNPWVSIDPMLVIPGVRQLIRRKTAVAVSPIIGGKTVKGPAAKMYAELGIEPSSLAVAVHYQAFLNGFVIDNIDQELAEEIEELGIRTMATNSIMKDKADRARLAREVLEFGIQTLKSARQEK